MKKLLLSTTAIAAFAVTAEAEANSLQVNVGGYVDFQAGYVSDDIVGENGNDANETNFNTDSEIHFIIEGKADNGLEYGAVVELEANVGTTNDTFDNGDNADKAYLFVQGGWGRVELGENTGAEEALAVTTANFASATGGIDGDFFRFAGIGANQAFLIKPRLALAANGATAENDEDATKITYYSPRFSGFQVGVSYIPNTGSTNRNAAGGTVNAGSNENVFTGGVNYTGQFDEIGVAASLTGITGDGQSAGTNDLEGYQAGANISLAGFTLGGSYGDFDNSVNVLGAVVSADSEYYDIGLGYAAGPYSASVTYIDSENEIAGVNNDFDNIVIGADYQLAPGFVPYAEVSFFDYDSPVAGASNDGTVVILGTELTF